jgi:hypothetical protein
MTATIRADCGDRPGAVGRQVLWMLVGLAAAALTKLSAQAADPPLSLERTIPLQSVSGRIDHMAFDLGRKRLIVTELGNNIGDVIDVVSGTPVHPISGLREPQGIGYAQRADVIPIANAGDGSVRLLKATDFSPAGSISLGDDADNIRIDPRNGNAVIGYGSGGQAVVDPASGTKLADVHLPAHPESFQIDPQTGRLITVTGQPTRLAGVHLVQCGGHLGYKVQPAIRPRSRP